MSYVSDLSQSSEYLSFRSSIPLRKIVVDCDGSKAWRIYDSGPKSVSCPLLCLPPVSGTADVFFRQVMGLSARGVRVIAVESPAYWNIREWCDGFKRLLDYLEIDKVHLFGASLGGFIAQKFAELTDNCPRVASLVLCNTFTDTSVFEYKDSSALFWLLPSLMLKRMLMANFTTDKVDNRIRESIDFMVERVESLTQADLASRLTLNCSTGYVQADRLSSLPVTIMDVWDDSALSSNVREDLYKCYPQAKLAHLKSGGNFPYLSRSDEVNLHLLVYQSKGPHTALVFGVGEDCSIVTLSKESRVRLTLAYTYGNLMIPNYQHHTLAYTRCLPAAANLNKALSATSTKERKS